MRRQWHWRQNDVFLGLVVGSALLACSAAAQLQSSAPLPPLAPGTFRLVAMSDTVSLEAQAASLAAIFAEIRRQTGIVVHLPRAADDTITLHIDQVPLREALTRLARNVVIINARGPDAPSHGIAAVYVLASSQAEASPKGPDRPPPPGETGHKPASRPAPFQFTFDPSQHLKQP